MSWNYRDPIIFIGTNNGIGWERTGENAFTGAQIRFSRTLPNAVTNAPRGSLMLVVSPANVASAWLNTDGGTTWTEFVTIAGVGQTLQETYNDSAAAPGPQIVTAAGVGNISILGTEDFIFGGTVDTRWLDGRPAQFGTDNDWTISFDNAAQQLNAVGRDPPADTASVQLRMDTGNAVSDAGTVASGAITIETGTTTTFDALATAGATGAVILGSGNALDGGAGVGGASGAVTVRSGTSVDSTSGAVTLSTGNVTAGVGGSGAIVLTTGTSAGGARGAIDINSPTLDTATQAITWTLIDNNATALSIGAPGVTNMLVAVTLDVAERWTMTTRPVATTSGLTMNATLPNGDSIAAYGALISRTAALTGTNRQAGYGVQLEGFVGDSATAVIAGYSATAPGGVATDARLVGFNCIATGAVDTFNLVASATDQGADFGAPLRTAAGVGLGSALRGGDAVGAGPSAGGDASVIGGAGVGGGAVGNVVLTGTTTDLNTATVDSQTQATQWTAIDATVAALQFGATGALNMISLDTTNGAERVTVGSIAGLRLLTNVELDFGTGGGNVTMNPDGTHVRVTGTGRINWQDNIVAGFGTDLDASIFYRSATNNTEYFTADVTAGGATAATAGIQVYSGVRTKTDAAGGTPGSGAILLTSGNTDVSFVGVSTGGNTGAFDIRTGDATSTGAGSTSGTSGNISLITGLSDDAGTGAIGLTTGASGAAGATGSITLATGATAGTRGILDINIATIDTATQATSWTLIDATVNALQIGAPGATGIVQITTTNAAERVDFNTQSASGVAGVRAIATVTDLPDSRVLSATMTRSGALTGTNSVAGLFVVTEGVVADAVGTAVEGVRVRAPTAAATGGILRGFVVEASTDTFDTALTSLGQSLTVGAPVRVGAGVGLDTVILGGAASGGGPSAGGNVALTPGAGVGGGAAGVVDINGSIDTATQTTTWALNDNNALALSFTAAGAASSLLVFDTTNGSEVVVVAAPDGLRLNDNSELRFGTPGTDIVFTPDGTGLALSGTGDIAVLNNLDIQWGTSGNFLQRFDSAGNRLQTDGTAVTDGGAAAATAAYRVVTGNRIKNDAAGGTPGSGSVTLQTGNTDVTAVATGGDSGGITFATGNATSTAGTSGGTGAIGLTTGNSDDGPSGNIVLATGTAGTTRGILDINIATIDTVTQAVQWTLIDASATAIQIGAAGLTNILTIDTTNGAEEVESRARLTTTDGIAAGTTRVVGGRAFAETADSAAVTGIGETAFDQTYSIPANTLGLGSTVRVKFQGRITLANGADTLIIRGRIGGQNVAVTPTVDVAAGDTFVGEFWVTTRAAAGAAVDTVGGGIAGFSTTGSSTRANGLADGVSLATNGALTVDVTAQFSSADAGNSCRLELLIVDVV